MKYAELYQIVEPLVAPTLIESSFRRLESGPPNWAKHLDNEFLTFSIFVSRKFPSHPMRGGRFFARFSRNKTEKPDLSKPLGLVRLLSDEALIEMKRLENTVLDNLIAQKGDNPQDEQMLAALRESWKLEKRFPCRRNADLGLIFYSRVDAEAWGQFIAKHLPTAIRHLERSADSWSEEIKVTGELHTSRA